MALARGRDTSPELAVRKALHAHGNCYRLYVAHLHGKPDTVFRRRRKVIFVHGCIGSMYEGCALTRILNSRQAFCGPKLRAKRERDAARLQRLRELGWRAMVVWECELRDMPGLLARIETFLNKDEEFR
jgi:DNA mismatch endonuclease (patch repair protein)